MINRMDLRAPVASRLTRDHLNTVILCEAMPLLASPIRTLQSLATRFWGEIEIQASLWRFEALSFPPVLAAAGQATADAGLIAVATRSRDDLPSTVTGFLRQALQARASMPTALVHFLQRPGGDVTTDLASRSLRRLALQAGADFFATDAPTGSEAKAPVTEMSIGLLERWPGRRVGVQHWGLNE